MQFTWDAFGSDRRICGALVSVVVFLLGVSKPGNFIMVSKCYLKDTERLT